MTYTNVAAKGTFRVKDSFGRALFTGWRFDGYPMQAFHCDWGIEYERNCEALTQMGYVRYGC